MTWSIINVSYVPKIMCKFIWYPLFYTLYTLYPYNNATYIISGTTTLLPYIYIIVVSREHLSNINIDITRALSLSSYTNHVYFSYA